MKMIICQKDLKNTEVLPIKSSPSVCDTAQIAIVTVNLVLLLMPWHFGFWLASVQSVTCLWISFFCSVCMAYGFLGYNVRPIHITSVQSTLSFLKANYSKRQMWNVSHLMMSKSAKQMQFCYILGEKKFSLTVNIAMESLAIHMMGRDQLLLCIFVHDCHLNLQHFS